MKKQFTHALAALAMVSCGGTAHAGFVDIVFSGIADFQIGEQTIDDAAFTVRTTANTNLLFHVPVQGRDYTALQYEGLAGALTIEGLGEGTITEAISVFNNPTEQVLGLMAVVNFMPFHSLIGPVDMFGLVSPQLASYDLKSDLLLEDAGFYDGQQWYEVETSLGKVTATGFESVKLQVTTVPEASTSLLFALGGCGLLWAAARRRG